MSVGPKLATLKNRLAIVTFMILGNLEAAPEKTMQLRGLIKGLNERSWHQLHFVFVFVGNHSLDTELKYQDKALTNPGPGYLDLKMAQA